MSYADELREMTEQYDAARERLDERFARRRDAIVAAHLLPVEGCDRCVCGAKYWDGDRCHSCGDRWPRCAATNQGEQ